MKRSTRCDYSLRAVLELSFHYEKKLVRVSDLSDAQDIPLKFLEQIMLQLKKSGYVRSKKGPNGGYSLTKAPGDIFLGEIIRLVDDRLFAPVLSEPMNRLTTLDAARDNFFGVWAEVEDAMASVLDSISLADIQKRQAEVLSKKKLNMVYHI
ncbi:MAG: Rrf2 family transcriptional regulator [SAR324 cluster bacterium]|nr:Rrf2 family transcriptional regulator [SAR324 cluster bacterium]